MNIGRDILVGVAVGDALGVPVEFKSRDHLQQQPITDMIGFGTHQQPKGTWSDDSSLTFCLADSLAEKGYDLADMAENILAWFNQEFWTAHGKVFDIGGQTRNAIDELTAIVKRKNYQALKSRKNTNEYANGNGALMRILPLAFETYYLKNIEEKFEKIRAVDSLTHGHIRSALACFIYIVFAEELMAGYAKETAYSNTKRVVNNAFQHLPIPQQEQLKFARILDFNIANFDKIDIQSNAYVVHSLEASLWCLMRHTNYEQTVLEAVNLGGDTDTIGAITGGLAALLYGTENIPIHWKNTLVKRKQIEDLGDRLYRRYFL